MVSDPFLAGALAAAASRSAAAVEAAPAPQLPPFRAVPLELSVWAHHLERGYAQRVAVLSVSSPRRLAWLVRVQGSKGAVYAVRVRPDTAAAGLAFEASCSCPAGEAGRHWCKHAALALARLGILPGPESPVWLALAEAAAA